jgi:hypothetical protein
MNDNFIQYLKNALNIKRKDRLPIENDENIG